MGYNSATAMSVMQYKGRMGEGGGKFCNDPGDGVCIFIHTAFG